MSDEDTGLPRPPPTTTSAMTGAEFMKEHAAEAVQGLRVYGTNHPRWFRTGEQTITIGRAPSNMLVVSDNSVSREHAVMIRKGGETWIEDRDSDNGIWLDEKRLPNFRIVPGTIFQLGKVSLVAINDRLEELRARFQRYLGYDNAYQRRVDAALYAASRRSHVLLHEPPGGGVNGLTKLFHQAWRGDAWPLVSIEKGTTVDEASQRELLRRAKMGTLVVSDSKWLAKANVLRTALAERRHGVRLVAVMKRGIGGEGVLGSELRDKTVTIEVPSLSERMAVEVSKVIDSIAAEVGIRVGATTGLDDKDSKRLLLLAAKWKHNYDDAEHNVGTVALTRMIGQKNAWPRLGYESASGLSNWMTRHGFD